MKFITAIFLIIVCSAVAEYFLPWWMIAVVAFFVAFAMSMRPGKAFLAGFLGVAVFWLVAALYRDIPNNHILSSRMAVLFFKKPYYPLFMSVTILIGGLVGGMAAWAASFFRSQVK